MAAEREVGVDPLLDGRGALLFELCPLGPRDRVVQVGQWRAAPQLERRAERFR